MKNIPILEGVIAGIKGKMTFAVSELCQNDYDDPTTF